MQAGFAEVDITPPAGTHKIGWIIDLVGEEILDPLYARAAVFTGGGQSIAVLQLDLLCIMAGEVAEIRRRAAAKTGLAPEAVMVAATHNHAGPAVAQLGQVARDDAYTAWLVERGVEALARAWANRQPAEVGINHVYEWEVAHNRRIVMRDGTARTHGSFSDPGALYVEGPVDPEVAVIAARAPGGPLLGCLVNFACHPTHHGGDNAISAGFPGVLAAEMRARGCPVTLFLNGSSGNVHTADPRYDRDFDMAEAGKALAEDAGRALAGVAYRPEMKLGAASARVPLPYRRSTPAEIAGTNRGAQRFVLPAEYDREMPVLLEEMKAGAQEVEVQVLSLDEIALAGVPAEYFVEFGLRIKTESSPRHALVVSLANDAVGYIPTREAFARGGYETTLCLWSKFAPEAGDLLADAAIALIAQGGSA